MVVPELPGKKRVDKRHSRSFYFIVGFARIGGISSHIIDDIDIDCETHPRSVLLRLLSDTRRNK